MTLWVGTYREQGGRGLTPLVEKGETLVAGKPERHIANASYTVASAHTGLFYFVDEQDAGRVVAWRHKDGRWHDVGSIESGGALPCYLDLSSDGRWLAVANYGDGTLGLLSLDPPSGKFEALAAVHRPKGKGFDPERQDGPHAHCAVFTPDARTLYHVDLGLDRVFAHDLTKPLPQEPEVAFEAPPGWGPRHLVLHPDGRHALLICELAARLLLLRRDGTRLVRLHDVGTAPEPCEGNLGGHLSVEPDGSVYVTNRGHDSLVRFTIDEGQLTMREWWPTGGSSPRHFLLRQDGSALVAHEKQGGVRRVVLNHDGENTQVADLGGAAYIIEIPD